MYMTSVLWADKTIFCPNKEYKNTRKGQICRKIARISSSFCPKYDKISNCMGLPPILYAYAKMCTTCLPLRLISWKPRKVCLLLDEFQSEFHKRADISPPWLVCFVLKDRCKERCRERLNVGCINVRLCGVTT